MDRSFRRYRIELRWQCLRACRRTAELRSIPCIHGSESFYILALWRGEARTAPEEHFRRHDPAACWVRVLRTHLVEPQPPGHACGWNLVRRRRDLHRRDDKRIPDSAKADRFQ